MPKKKRDPENPQESWLEKLAGKIWTKATDKKMERLRRDAKRDPYLQRQVDIMDKNFRGIKVDLEKVDRLLAQADKLMDDDN